MKKLYTHIEYNRVGHLQSFLKEQGIETHVKNKSASTGMGEIPFLEVWPELWVNNDDDFDKAKQLVDELNSQAEAPIAAWKCPSCGEEVDAGFGQCWNCDTLKP